MFTNLQFESGSVSSNFIRLLSQTNEPFQLNLKAESIFNSFFDLTEIKSKLYTERANLLRRVLED